MISQIFLAFKPRLGITYYNSNLGWQMSYAFWSCSVCGHEALEYDEVDHECFDEATGETTDYVAIGDEGV
jgi:hypothetical protein